LDTVSEARVTACLIVKDEQALLPRCLESLVGVVDEVVAVDTGSRDRTADVLAAAAARDDFHRFRWSRSQFVDFGTNRQQALGLVETPWALWIDADEVLSPALRLRLDDLRRAGGLAAHGGWEIQRVNRVLGRVMTGRNLAGQYVLRLFRTRGARFSDSLVHEGVMLPAGASVGRLDEPILHDAMPSWRGYLRKVDLYTTLDAASGAKPFRPLHLLVTGPLTFWRHFVGRGGWRDGWPGLVWALTSGWGSVLRDVKRARRRISS
jgi:(heptosyl)LPS beta-1,4-glucosyltransferase